MTSAETIMELKNQGLNASEITRKLKESGVKTKKGKPFSYQQVYLFLKKKSSKMEPPSMIHQNQSTSNSGKIFWEVQNSNLSLPTKKILLKSLVDWLI